MSSITDSQQDVLQILNAAPDNYLVLLPNPPRFTIVGVTDSYLKATFTKREMILNKGLFEIFPDNPQLPGATGVKNLGASLQQVLETGQEHRMADQRYDVADPNGEGFVYKVWRPLNRPVFDHQGNLKYIIHKVADVTELAKAKEREVQFETIDQAFNELKRTENALKESEVRFRTMANSIPQLAWMTDETGWIYWYNDRWYDYTGTTPDEMLGWGWRKVHHPDYVEGVVARIKKAFESGNTWEDTFLLRSRFGEYRWFLSRAMPVRKDDGTLIGWFGTNTDITEQRRTEEALEKSEEQLLLALEGGELGYFDYNPGRSELKWSARTRELFGVPPDVPVDFNFYLQALHPEDRQRTLAAVEKALDPRVGLYENEYRVVDVSDGRVRWLRSKAKTFSDENGNARRLAGVTMDITKQKTAELALQESHKEFQFAMDFLPQMFWLAWPDGYHYYFNKQWYDYTGLLFDSARGGGWHNLFHPDDQERAWELWQNSLATGDPYELEYRLRRFDGEFRWFLVRALPLRDETGAISKWFGTCTDIHDQKTFMEQQEKMVAERTKELKQSNEDLQQFAHVSSHDLKEPLRKIRLFASRLANESEGCLDERNKNYLTKVQSAAERMWQILDGVLNYSKVNFMKEIYEPVNLNDVIRNVESDLELPIQAKGADVDYNNLPTLEGAPIMLYLVFYNLVSNSLKFSREDEPPVITITAEPIDQKAKSFTRITISDNGIGFEQQFADKIFGAFTRLHSKDRFEGAGLGLSICKKIVERHGGTITAKGAENVGSQFEILLPVRQ